MDGESLAPLREDSHAPFHLIDSSGSSSTPCQGPEAKEPSQKAACQCLIIRSFNTFQAPHSAPLASVSLPTKWRTTVLFTSEEAREDNLGNGRERQWPKEKAGPPGNCLGVTSASPESACSPLEKPAFH